MTLPDPQTPADRYLAVKALLFEALERSPDERRAFLVAACRGDQTLLDEIDSLLEQIDQLDGFLEERVDLEAHAPANRRLPGLVTKRFGDYRVVELIGYGGMGMVYLAEQRTPRRRVALKVLRNDCPDELARKRFQREAEVLGRLQHSGIAQIYEAGVQETDAGSMPYFAMEYVEGESIRDFAHRVGLTTSHAFALIAEVGDALQHAHDQGVLHRDLKPGNILVSKSGEPKLLDFGVALVRDDQEMVFRTRTGQLLGTIAYMSPEQARGDEVDEQADQFSLAVILYELLTGRLPFDTQTSSLPELVRSIVEDEPRPLSEDDRTLRGDAHTIVHKALAKDPSQRYPSVAAFAEDLRRFVEGQPILARPPSASYRLGRLLNRHRALSATASVVAVAALAGAFLGSAIWREAQAAVRRADTSSERAQRLMHARMLDELIEEADELWPAGPTLVPALDRWLARASDLERSLPGHRERLAQLGGELDGEPEDGTSASSDAVWLFELQETFVADLEAFARAEPPGLIARVAARRRNAAELVEATIDGHASEWDATLAALADADLYPAYRGLRMEPQIGLVPLGPDPHSGLFEFALHAPTGTVPARDPATGELRIEPDSTLVLVLLPGGRVTLGAQRDDPLAPHHDPLAKNHEGPVFEVELAPFFISKYELTQAQWVNFGESTNPSYWEAGSVHRCDIPFTRRNPVEHVSRRRAIDFLRKLGLELPTEAQWEYAARGGSALAHWGLDDATFARHVNALGHQTELDPYRSHAPAGSFAPNGFGLHDVLGNVWELCRDDYKVDYPRLPKRPGDGLVLADGGGDYSVRGGCAGMRAADLRVSSRADLRLDRMDRNTGVRPARRLAGSWSSSSEDER